MSEASFGANAETAAERELLAAFAAAGEQLGALQGDLQQTLDDMNSRPLLSDEERKALEEQAESGRLGEGMKELVTKIKAGEDSWEAVFAGESPNGTLLQSHLTKLVEDNIEDLQLAFEDLLDAEEAKGNFILDELAALRDDED